MLLTKIICVHQKKKNNRIYSQDLFSRRRLYTALRTSAVTNTYKFLISAEHFIDFVFI